MKKKKSKPDTLDEILHLSWEMLTRGATHFNDPFHWPVLGSLGENGCSQRTVILRQFDLPHRMLVCHTDRRAGKAREIAHSDQVSWLFYHPKKKIQLSISGTATLHTDDGFADEQWALSSLTSRLNYCATQPPGTPVDAPSSGLPDFLLNKVPTLAQSEKGRHHFMAISCRIDYLDWLHLNVLGNRRACFRWDENKLHASWVIP